METITEVYRGYIVEVTDNSDRTYVGYVVENYSSETPGLVFGIRVLEGLEGFPFKHSNPDMGLVENHKFVYAPDCKEIKVLATPEKVSSERALTEGILESPQDNVGWYRTLNPRTNEWITLCECMKGYKYCCDWSFDQDEKAGLTESYNRINSRNFIESQLLDEASKKKAETSIDDLLAKSRDVKDKTMSSNLEDLGLKDGEIRSLDSITQSVVNSNREQLRPYGITGGYGGESVISYEDIKQEVLYEIIKDFQRNVFNSKKLPGLFWEITKDENGDIKPVRDKNGHLIPRDSKTNRINENRSFFRAFATYKLNNILRKMRTDKRKVNTPFYSDSAEDLAASSGDDISATDFLDHVLSERGDMEADPSSSTQKELRGKLRKYFKDLPSDAPERIFGEWTALEAGIDIDTSDSKVYEKFKSKYEPAEDADSPKNKTSRDRRTRFLKEKHNNIVSEKEIKDYIIDTIEDTPDAKGHCILRNSESWKRFKDQMEWVLRKELGLGSPIKSEEPEELVTVDKKGSGFAAGPVSNADPDVYNAGQGLVGKVDPHRPQETNPWFDAVVDSKGNLAFLSSDPRYKMIWKSANDAIAALDKNDSEYDKKVKDIRAHAKESEDKLKKSLEDKGELKKVNSDTNPELFNK